MSPKFGTLTGPLEVRIPLKQGYTLRVYELPTKGDIISAALFDTGTRYCGSYHHVTPEKWMYRPREGVVPIPVAVIREASIQFNSLVGDIFQIQYSVANVCSYQISSST